MNAPGKTREERAQLLREARDTKDKIINEERPGKLEAIKSLRMPRLLSEQQKNGRTYRCKKQGRKLVIEISEKILRRELSGKAEQEILSGMAKWSKT